MSTTSYVVLGAARPRSAWFAAVAQWSHAAALPVEFVKCLGPDDLRAHLHAGRSASAALVDGGMPGVDRDLIADVHAAGAAVIVVADARVPVDWAQLGADAVLVDGFDRTVLLDACTRVARRAPVRTELLPLTDDDPSGTLRTDDGGAATGRLVAVVGGGGAGTSTIAMAIAQGLSLHHGGPREGHERSARPRRRRPTTTAAPAVILADLCRHAELAMLHDTDVVSPGLQELLEIHRTTSPRPGEVRSLCFTVPDRGYALLLGLRRAHLWTTVRPASAASAIAALQRAFEVVVTDVDDDVEGEEHGGSLDVEERNLLTRTAVRSADAVIAVGDASLKGVHTLVRVVRALQDLGVDPDRIQPVLNRAPDSRRARAELTDAVARLTTTRAARRHVRPPVFVPLRDLDGCHRSVRPFPDAVVVPPTLAVAHLLATARPEPTTTAPRRITPGSLGTHTRPTLLGRGTEGMSA